MSSFNLPNPGKVTQIESAFLESPYNKRSAKGFGIEADFIHESGFVKQKKLSRVGLILEVEIVTIRAPRIFGNYSSAESK